MIEYALTKANRLRLAQAFRHSPRVDIAIECVIEGQMGRACVDNADNPSAFRIQSGPFQYYCGDAKAGRESDMLAEITLMMTAPPEWIEAARDIHGEKLKAFSRYSFSEEKLSIAYLDTLREGLTVPASIEIRQIDMALAERIIPRVDFVDISDFDSAADFVERGIGFCAMDKKDIIGVIYSSLVNSHSIEISLFVMPEHRRKSIATALACQLLKVCLARGLEPHWDAANQESCNLAKKLGYTPAGSYTAYYVET